MQIESTESFEGPQLYQALSVCNPGAANFFCEELTLSGFGGHLVSQLLGHCSANAVTENKVVPYNLGAQVSVLHCSISRVTFLGA